jgi:hypothetical protein
MNKDEFDVLSEDLRTLAKNIPLHWGYVQNNRIDDRINMFSINSYQELENQISNLSDDKKNYLRRRWYLWKCSQCDEYLFYKYDNVEKNPNPYDKSWDVRIDNKYSFDIKGTVIPKDMRDSADSVIENPKKMIEFFYEKQSTGRRYDIQNRLFIVHHSFIEPEREFYLRCAWQSKEQIYKEFIDNIDNIQFVSTHGVKAGVIFVLERNRSLVEYNIAGMNS